MKLLKIEWRKLRGHNFFWIGMGLYALCMVLLITGFGSIELIQGQNEEGALIKSQSFGEAGLYKLPYIWQNITYLAGFFKIIPSFLLILFVSNEYQYRTLRQNIIDGLSVGQFYWSKMISVLGFAIFSFLVIGITGLIIALMYNVEADFSEYVSHIDYLVAFFAEVLFMITFAVFLTLLFKRSTISIIVILAYYFIIEPIAGFVLNRYVAENAGTYLPTAPSRELILQPFTRMLKVEGFLGIESPDSVSYKYLLITFLYTLIFAAGGYLILKKRDL